MYNFRHSWVCTYLDSPGDIFGAAMMLGTSVKMLQIRYFHMDEEKLHARHLQFMSEAVRNQAHEAMPEMVDGNKK